MPQGQSPEALFAERLAAEPSRPFVSFYDDASGDRAELSARSLANWVAKTHFLLLDELGLGPGDQAFVSLAAHWLAVPILLGCWSAGLEVVGEPSGAAVAFGEANALQAADLTAVTDVFAISLLSMGRSDTPPKGMQDFAAAVRPQPDAWTGVRSQAAPPDAALNGISRADLVDRARKAATEIGLQPGGRLLATRTWRGPDDWVTSLVAPLAVGGSLILVRNSDAALVSKHAAGERATVIR